MTLYLTFPVAMFWIANQAEWFEDYVIQRKVGTGRVFMGSFQGVGERMEHQPAGDQCLLPTSQPCPGWGALEAPGSCYQLLLCPHRGSCGHLRRRTR